MKDMFERRHFLAGMAAAACSRPSPSTNQPSSGPLSPDASPASPSSTTSLKPSSAHDALTQSIPRRKFGSSGETVSALGLGGYHLGIPGEREAIAIMHRAIDEGIDFFDNCWDYHGGESEVRMGKALRDGKREKVFLMTKIDGRNKQAAAAQIDASLARLGTDHVDLMQIHEVIREKDPAWVFGEDGAVAALLAAKQAGKIRYIGFTGHKSPSIHLAMLDEAKKHGFRFDAVQLPLNVLDPHYDSFQKRVLPVLVQEGIAVLGMKPLASGAALESGVSASQCLRYALSLDTSVVITGCDRMDILEQAIAVGRGFEPMDESERLALLTTTETDGKDGHLEGFKTSARFDATERNQHWLTTGQL